jgi:hypothetical protein
MSPEALRTRKISTPIAKSTKIPTRNWLRVTFFFDGGMIVIQVDGWPGF